MENYQNRIDVINIIINNLLNKKENIIDEYLKTEKAKQIIQKFCIENFKMASYCLSDKDALTVLEIDESSTNFHIDLKELTKHFFNDAFLGYMLDKVNQYYTGNFDYVNLHFSDIKFDIMPIYIQEDLYEFNFSYIYYLNEKHNLKSIIK